MSCNCARDAIKVGRPSAARLEFVIGLVEGLVAPSTSVDSLFRVVLVELSGSRRLSALFSQDAKLLCGLMLVGNPEYLSFALTRRHQRTFVEDGLPLGIRPLIRIRHVGRF